MGAQSIAPSPEEPATELPSFEVTATHFGLPITTVPVAAEILGAEQLHAFAAVTLPEALTQVPGVTVRNGTIDLRGQGESAGKRVLVLVDGRRVNRPDLGGINWSQLPADQIARVEVLKGGQSVIYGDQAIGGVIKITTARSFQPGGTFSVLAGSDQLLQLRASAHFPLTTDDFIRIGLSKMETDGYRERSATEAFSAQMAWRRENAWGGAWSTQLQWVETETQLPGPLYSTDFPENPRTSTIGGQSSREQDRILDSEWTHDDFFGGVFTLPLNVQKQNVAWNLPGAWGDNELLTLQLRPRFTREFGLLTLTAGLDGIRDRFDFTGYDDRERTEVVSEASITRKSAAAYGHFTWEPEPAWRFSWGGRFESWDLTARNATDDWRDPDPSLIPQYDEKKTDTGAAATLGVVWRPRSDFRAWLRYDHVYRFPATDELASYQNYALAEPFNRALGAESGDTVELGLGWQAGLWYLQGSVFAQRLDDEIQYDPNAFLNRNLPGSDRLGGECSLERRGEFWNLRLSWTQLEAEIREGIFEGMRPALVPRRQARASATWKPLAWLHGTVAVRYFGRQFEGNYLALVEAGLPNPNPYIPPHAVTDASVWIRLGEHWSLRAVLENAFDRNYASLKFQGGWYPEPGCSGRVQVTAHF